MLHLFSLPTTLGAVIPNVVLVLFLLFRFRADNTNSNGAKELQIESTSVATGWPTSLSSLNLVFRKYYFWSKILDERPKGWSGRAVAGLRGSGRGGARLNFGW